MMKDLCDKMIYTSLDIADLTSIYAGTLKDAIKITGFATGTLIKLLQCHFETGNSILFIYESNFNI